MATAPSPLTTILALTITGAILLALYLQQKHYTLRIQITHHQIQTGTTKNTIQSLPQDVLTHPETYRIVHELDSIRLFPRHQNLHDDSDNAILFTRLMQHNMLLFANYAPQAYLMRYLLPHNTAEQRMSFSKAHIAHLAFQPDDLVCGVYRVLVREPWYCEMGMDAGSLGGRLVTRIVDGGEGGALDLQTETVQWVRNEEGMVLPLERRALRWLHEFVCWGLLVSGKTWLEEEMGRVS